MTVEAPAQTATPLPALTPARAAALTMLGVVILSFDALLVRLIPGDVVTVSFWRGLLMAVGFYGLYVAGHRRLLAPRHLFVSRPALAASVLYGLSTLGFVGAIKNTDAASALMIIATVPLCAALISWIALGERVKRATWIAIAGATVGLGVVFVSHVEGGGLLGKLFALGTTITVSGYLTILRSGRLETALPALTGGGLVCALISVPLTGTLLVPVDAVPYVILLGLVVMPIAMALIAQGPKVLATADVGLIMLSESLIGSFYVWLFPGEVPALTTVIGGAIVIGSLVLRAFLRDVEPAD